MRKNYRKVSTTNASTGQSDLGIVNANDREYSVKQFAEMMHRTEDAIRKQIRNKTLPARKRGKKWHILHSEFIAFIRSCPSSMNSFEGLVPAM